MSARLRGVLAPVALFAAACALYAPALGFAFLAFDDPVYVTDNPAVKAGLSAESVRWAFATFHGGNWHPLTWLSHMRDVAWFGLAPAGHHATNVALHAGNAALLFLALRALSLAPGRSFAVAALFALHPLQLESVAWVAERKNLLSTSFGLLAFLAYADYARRGGALRYAAVCAAFAASLGAKSMLVTLPFVLALFDVWPLARWRTVPIQRLVLEKLPLLALSAVASAIAVAAQDAAGAMASTTALPVAARIAYAPIAVAQHLAHFFWPTRLAVLYPHPLLATGAELPLAAALAAAALLAGVSAALGWLAWRGRPAALVGWLLFLGTLVPVIGLVQVGNQALADRYAYVPMLGLLVALVWCAGDLLGRLGAERRRRAAGAAATLALCAVLAFAARAQLPVWRDSRSLFEHALAVTGPNPVMHRELGILLASGGELAAALPHFERAVALAPEWGLARYNLGGLLAELGRPERGLPHLERAATLAPERANVQAALGAALLRLGRAGDAIAPLEAAVRLEPSATHLALLADAEAASGRLDAAVASQRRAVAAAEAAGDRDAARLRARLAALERERGGAPSRDAVQLVPGRR